MGTETPIVPRKVDLGFPADVPRHWAGDAMLTRVADALSLLFPVGEAFFIESVQHYRDRITDPTLRRQVKEFAYQEGQHSRSHAAFNRMLAGQGLSVDWVERSLEFRLGVARRHFSPEFRLAATACAEHLTATMAEALLVSMHDHFAHADPRMRALYYWHAVEEVEHKAVSWDVYERVAHGGWLRRVLTQLFVTQVIALNTIVVVIYMLHKDGLLFDAGTWRRGLATLWGRGGFFTRMVRPYLRGFRPGFHPWQTEIPPGFAAFVHAWPERKDAMAATAEAMAAA
jgi:predicted metal-dependent hydrolase